MYVQLVYVIPQVFNTSFWLITSNQCSTKSGDLLQANPMVRLSDPISTTTKNKKAV